MLSDISATDNTLQQTPGAYMQFSTAAMVPTNANAMGWVHGPLRVSLSATTIYYLVAYATFTVTATINAYGNIRARRVR